MDVRASAEELEKGPAVGQSNTAVVDAGPGDGNAVKPFVVVRVKREEHLPDVSAELPSPGASAETADLRSQVAQLALHEDTDDGHAYHAPSSQPHDHALLISQASTAPAHAQGEEQDIVSTSQGAPVPASHASPEAACRSRQQTTHQTISVTPSTSTAEAAPTGQGGAPNLISRFKQQRSTPEKTATPSLDDLAASARAALAQLRPGADHSAVAAALGPLSKEQVLELGLADMVLAVLGGDAAPGPAAPQHTTAHNSAVHSKRHQRQSDAASEVGAAEVEEIGEEESALSAGGEWGRMLAYRAQDGSTVAGSEAGEGDLDEENPFQVLDESLIVLAEVEGLIRESLGLAPGAILAMGELCEEEVARVPQPLLDALEGTINVIMESRSEIEEITSALLSPASTSPYMGRRLGDSGAGRLPGPSSGGIRGSPYLNQGTPTRHAPGTPSRHIRQVGSQPTYGSPSRPLSAAMASPSNRAGGGRGRYGSGPSQRGSSGVDDGLGPSASSASLGAASSQGGSIRVSDGGRSTATTTHGPPPGGYMYQRAAARQAAVEEEERRAALEARRRRLENGSSIPDAGWVSGQEVRAAEARRKRVQQVAADLAYIDGLRARTAAAREQHLKAVANSDANIAELRVHKAETQAANKWLKYQEHVAARERMRRAVY